MIRMPAVAGRFYEANPELLRQEIESYLDPTAPKEAAIGAVCPHAGYMFSGHVAGAVYSRLIIPDTVVILGPNHTGLGHPAAVMAKGTWQMPFGPVAIDENLAGLILQESQVLSHDVEAHLYEHSLEVQVPFLQYLNPEVSIVPICISHLPYEALEDIGLALAKGIAAYDKPVLIVISTDMSHYVPHEVAKQKDALAIEKIMELDALGLLEVVTREKISMCGVFPAAAGIIASRALGAKGAKLIKYATSGEVSGDFYQVVGYAGLIIR
ncbi:AmmeMemoRadiSam system protein B [Thermodesulfatator autotrophicus]|uniref:MEMO1 family protein TH606_09895 n=1 Tax=Thermodesulfatator autotrophicus TaxID=1795632 RepID=A0A177E7A8_9BACT|nr:AmmeMemoRadiSam system protein B [Thermodesulfatator autotrophicus]OAG26899.1 extradiol dioxygenase [Thermodesulfatator autotrophicus]